MLKATQLKENKAQKILVKNEIRNILAYIDDELRNAHDSGKHNIVLTLPINFSIAYMDNKTAQRKIYYGVLTSLIERGFEPKIELQTEKTLLFIKWFSDEELEEISLQHTLLAKYTIKDLSKLNL